MLDPFQDFEEWRSSNCDPLQFAGGVIRPRLPHSIQGLVRRHLSAQSISLRQDLDQAQLGLTVLSGGQPFIHPEVLDAWSAAAGVQGQPMRLRLASPFGSPFVENLRIIIDRHHRSLLSGGCHA